MNPTDYLIHLLDQGIHLSIRSDSDEEFRELINSICVKLAGKFHNMKRTVESVEFYTKSGLHSSLKRAK